MLLKTDCRFVRLGFARAVAVFLEDGTYWGVLFASVFWESSWDGGFRLLDFNSFYETDSSFEESSGSFLVAGSS